MRASVSRLLTLIVSVQMKGARLLKSSLMKSAWMIARRSHDRVDGVANAKKKLFDCCVSARTTVYSNLLE